MKIGGVAVTKPSEKILVIEREDGPLVFRALALPSMDEFEQLVPMPKPPGKLTKDGFIPDANDPTYQTILGQHALKRLGYMVIRTLDNSKIEWGTVDPSNPKTWTNWEGDLKAAGFTQVERNRILELVIDVNTLDEEKIKAARDSFLRGQAAQKADTSGPQAEPENTLSGPPASGSA